MENKFNKKFTVGISYSKHLIKAKNTFQKIVVPQFVSKNQIEQTPVFGQKKLNLSPAQKAHLNCQSPI
jgi:hypothetical protein